MFDESERYSNPGSGLPCQTGRGHLQCQHGCLCACHAAQCLVGAVGAYVFLFFSKPSKKKKLNSPSSNSIQKCDSEVCSAIHFAHLVPSCRGEVVSQWHWAMILPLFHRPMVGRQRNITQFPSQSTPVCSSSIGSAIYFEFLNLVLSFYTLVFIESCQGYCLKRGTLICDSPPQTPQIPPA